MKSGDVVIHEYGQQMVVRDILLDDMVQCIYFNAQGGGLEVYSFHKDTLFKSVPTSTLKSLLTILKMRLTP